MNRLQFFELLGVGALVPKVNEVKAVGKRIDGDALLFSGEDIISKDTGEFYLEFDRKTHTLISLIPNTEAGFNFLPKDWSEKRKGNFFYNLGDINLRIRRDGERIWRSFSTAKFKDPVKEINVSGDQLLGAGLNPLFPVDFPLEINRFWETNGKGQLVLRYQITNRSKHAIEIGRLGLPMVFNNILSGRSLDDAHHLCSFVDPYIGMDAGYIQVTRLNGKGPALLVIPETNTPFEAYGLVKNDRTHRTQTFEGFYEWLVCTKAFTDSEWNEKKQWNASSLIRIRPGEELSIGLRFLLADEIRDVNKILIREDFPVAVGLPGYILPKGQDVKLFVHYSSSINSIETVPAGAITITKGEATPHGWMQFSLSGKQWGNTRLTIKYEDGKIQTIHYKVIKDQKQIVQDFASFLMLHQWYQNDDDVFGRSPSFITYDYFEKKPVLQDSRVWVAGLSDEAGNGSWLGMAMKQFIMPEIEEIKRLQLFIDDVVDGRLQHNEANKEYGIRRSLFYYEPNKFPDGTYSDDLDFSHWESWNQSDSEGLWRSYNYPPVAALYWVFYRLSRNYHDLVTNHGWKWYLKRSYQTGIAMVRYASELSKFGQMEGTIFIEILKDLKREGWKEEADEFEALMKKRADLWNSLKFPYGSEMPWDSTGQEEVYGWCEYFGYHDKASVTIDAIVGYMPSLPHWGYHGNARRYWDFDTAGKLRRLERQIHHYGSGLNALPVLSAYRSNPDDFHLLQIGYGGMMGAISNITEDGFGSCAFHAFPETLEIDAFSGDYGPNFFGHVMGTASYLVKHPEFGWIYFGGNIVLSKDDIKLTPLDSARTRIYIQPLKLLLVLETGVFDSLTLNFSQESVQIYLKEVTGLTDYIRLVVEQNETSSEYKFLPVDNYKKDRGAYLIPFKRDSEILVKFKWGKVNR